MNSPSELGYNLIHRFNIGDALRRSAAKAPRRRAIHFLGRDLTYSEFDALTNRVARLLLENGIGRGDKVAIFAMNSPEYAAVLFACGRIGAVLVPINLMFTAEDVAYVLEKTKVKALLMEAAFLPKVGNGPPIRFILDESFREMLLRYDSAPVETFVATEDPCLIIYTSGTTARPKGVVLNHLNWLAYLASAFTDLGLNGSLRYLLALPMFHVAGLVMTFACFAAGECFFFRQTMPARFRRVSGRSNKCVCNSSMDY